MAQPKKSYHFDLGNSLDSPVGFCGRVTAQSKQDAVRKFRAALEGCIGAEDEVKLRFDRVEHPDVEYISAYFNPDAVGVKDIDEVNPE